MMEIKQLSIILVAALFCSGFSNEETWVIRSESKLAIHGKTNLNTFSCRITSYSTNDTLRYFKDYTAGKMRFATNRLSIPIEDFNCGSRQISRDFRRSLRSDLYPQLNIEFISLEGLSVNSRSSSTGVVEITLVGVKTLYSIRFSTAVNNKGLVVLSGVQPVRFSDFGLSAPQKYKGLIRVDDVLFVDFYLVLKAV